MFQIEEGLAGVEALPRIRARGRYLFAGEDKFFIKGVTYGPFPENSRGEPLPEDETVAHDFELMRRAGINASKLPNIVWIDPDKLVRTCLADAERGRIESIPDWKWRAAMVVADHGPRAITRFVSAKLTASRKKH